MEKLIVLIKKYISKLFGKKEKLNEESKNINKQKAKKLVNYYEIVDIVEEQLNIWDPYCIMCKDGLDGEYLVEALMITDHIDNNSNINNITKAIATVFEEAHDEKGYLHVAKIIYESLKNNNLI